MESLTRNSHRRSLFRVSPRDDNYAEASSRQEEDDDPAAASIFFGFSARIGSGIAIPTETPSHRTMLRRSSACVMLNLLNHA